MTKTICFEHLFMETTDPETPYSRLLKVDTLASIVFHIFLYACLVYAFGYIFDMKFSSKVYMRLTLILLIIMVLGYVGRLSRAKYLEKVLNEKGEKEPREKAKQMIRTGYYTPYFLG